MHIVDIAVICAGNFCLSVLFPSLNMCFNNVNIVHVHTWSDDITMMLFTLLCSVGADGEHI